MDDSARELRLTPCIRCFPIPILAVSRSLRLGLTLHIRVQRPAGQPAAVSIRSKRIVHSTGDRCGLALWAGGNVLAELLTEPRGLIAFEIPDGWSNERFKNGRHFTRAGSADDPNILGVVPEHRDSHMTREKMSEGQ